MSRIEQSRAMTVVAIVSSNYLLRLGLQRIVEDEKWIRLIGQSANGTSFEDILTGEHPHIVIFDTEIERAVPDLIQTIKTTAPAIKIILLAGIDESEKIHQAFACGVDGLVLRMQPSPVLVATIEYLAHRTTTLTMPIGNRPTQLELSSTLSIIPASSTRTPDLPKWPDGLTEREREVVRLISEGLSNKDIADRLCISSITVRHHLTNIFDKLGVSNRQKLLIRAHQQGLVRPPALA
ncbi:MAG: Two-component transcriptional response regulator, LuxR family [Nitrospira sp.]|jgi:DNA-binding NarL/FixJ family response regulator|nr:MAG: Two-component transcriptional response regulator, LuxR family [Nitrospira sp.]